jgi:DNA mismatch repair protein MutS2
MDKKSLLTLEFNKVLERLAEHTSFSAGAALARTVMPTTDEAEARQWQAQTREAVELWDSGADVTIGGTRDVRRPADNAMRGFTLPPEDLLDIRNTLIAARTLKRKLLRVEYRFPQLAMIALLIEECEGLVSAIGQTLDDRGEVLDSASPQLSTIRRALRVAHGRIQEKLQNLVNSSMNQYLQEPIITTRSGRYVIPLKADYKGRVRGIVHDQSSSGATLWIEPLNTVELNNEYRELHLKEREEIARILAELSAKVAAHGESLKRVVERMAELDLIFARARYAVALDAVEPEFVPWRTFPPPKPPKHANEREKWQPPPPNPHPGSTIWVRGARHPLLNQAEVVPTDLLVNEETFLVLITGPNTGGKTVSLKTTGLMALMAQSGMHLPAIEARLTVFANVFADIGDEQSIEQSLSTFSAHITNIIHILENLDERSLVLLDELGSGTDPAEGASLAQAIVNFLRDKGATTFIATHYPELKVYASQTAGATNASLLFDIETLAPTFEMTIGLPGRSNAIAIARRLGLDETILDEALQLIGSGNTRAESLLESIYDIRERISSQEAAARMALKQVEAERNALQKRLDEIERERQLVLEEAREEAQEELAAMREELQQIRREIRLGRVEQDLSLNRVKELSKQVTEVEEGLAPADNGAQAEAAKKKSRRLRRALEVGDTVYVKPLGATGVVVSLAKKEAEVAVGRLHTRVRLIDLELRESVEPEVEDSGVKVTVVRSPGIELDLRGRRVEEGLSDLESYLDAAYLANLPFVRIIHGKGTGRMKEAVRKTLGANSHVSSWEEGKDGEGGAGVTVVKFAH